MHHRHIGELEVSRSVTLVMEPDAALALYRLLDWLVTEPVLDLNESEAEELLEIRNDLIWEFNDIGVEV